MALYKQRCNVCKKNWALMRSGYQRFAICEECEMKAISKPIEHPEMAKLFDIPLDWYRQNPFLRSVRYQYGRFGRLTDKQIEAFKKTVIELKENKKESAQSPVPVKRESPLKKKKSSRKKKIKGN